MGTKMLSRVETVKRLAVLGLSLALCLVCLGSLTASTASAASNVSIVRQTMEGTLKLKPGMWVAAGYVFRVKNAHPAMTVRIKQAQVTLNLRCEQSKKLVKMTVPLNAVQGYVDYTVPANDDSWRPTKDTNEADGYQGAARVPYLLCGSNEMLVSDGPAGGVNFNAEVKATNLTSDIEIKFHYRVPEAKGQANLNCDDRAVNPAPGIAPCTGKWSGPQTLRATDQPNPEGDDAQIFPNINGWVFNDLNGDGVFQPGDCRTGWLEPVIPGVTIKLYDGNTYALVKTAVTGSSELFCDYTRGRYVFIMDVPGPGQYYVEEVQPAGYTVSTTPNLMLVNVPFDGGVQVNFGNKP